MNDTDLNQRSAEAERLILATPADILPIVRAYLEGATDMAQSLLRSNTAKEDKK